MLHTDPQNALNMRSLLPLKYATAAPLTLKIKNGNTFETFLYLV